LLQNQLKNAIKQISFLNNEQTSLKTLSEYEEEIKIYWQLLDSLKLKNKH
jgi:hypothetical protein